ncbi:MAG TPA: PaeR7I family type II restriction endonuclease [Pyrinomonadaceae bacterium]|nr:PaeR7I family type II restriction endonuclease [Pyrinomonadaceae bacterium]
MSKLLPPDFENSVRHSVKYFWDGRLANAGTAQEGGRGAVIGGKNLDGFSELIRDVALFSQIPPSDIIVTGMAKLTIPGYFRPTKMWDALVIYKRHLVAAFELKSQVGPSFGNNFNNRSEESIGSAVDFWTAHREGGFRTPERSASVDLVSSKPPFLGYLMLLEECSASTKPVRAAESNYNVFPEFVDSSYAMRYQLLVERLVAEKWYSSGSLILSNRESGGSVGAYSSPTEALSPRSLFADFSAALLAAIEIY